MESSLIEWMAQITERAPKPVAGIASWIAAHVYFAIAKGPTGTWWFVHFIVLSIFSVVIPVITLVTSFQENVEWILRIIGLLIGMVSGGFTLMLSWPKVKSTFKKIVNGRTRRKR